MRNRIVSRSNTCRIQNALGTFSLCIFKIETRTDLIENVPVIWKGEFKDDIPVRINSACFTSESLGDQSCDCAWQLNAALEVVEREGQGLVIYCFSHEGRGVGLFHKVNSMFLMQDQGLTTASAFQNLGVGIDERDYSFAADILRYLGIRRVRLMTNNPSKHRSLTERGIEINDEIRLVNRFDPRLERYLASKQRDFGHAIDLTAPEKL
jgi:3,4-dihydroxy 2-butanone 4-phosphate synthase/GTP cyclohydrolase II